MIFQKLAYHKFWSRGKRQGVSHFIEKRLPSFHCCWRMSPASFQERLRLIVILITTAGGLQAFPFALQPLAAPQPLCIVATATVCDWSQFLCMSTAIGTSAKVSIRLLFNPGPASVYLAYAEQKWQVNLAYKDSRQRCLGSVGLHGWVLSRLDWQVLHNYVEAITERNYNRKKGLV